VYDTVIRPILDGLGAVLAFLYDLVPDYGVAIILLTLLIRLLLLPLGIKQIRSMHAMQALQPKVKALQQKYKGNRQKFAEEQMKLYRESGASPLGGCLPLLLQIPVLIALFAVLRFPNGLERIPAGSELRVAIESQNTEFLGANLLCAPRDAGKAVQVPGERLDRPLDCGGGFPVHVPYYLLLAAMIGTTFYQTWQMQRATPTKNPQQQLMGRIMPVFIGFIGWGFPAGLILYWTTTNLVQIGQQHFMLPKKGEGMGATEPPPPGDGERKKGKGRVAAPAPRPVKDRGQASASERAARRRARSSGQGKQADGGGANPRPGAAEAARSGEGHGRSRKKRRKR
jgi:YidC/Oxa1 family membrane protein insertase